MNVFLAITSYTGQIDVATCTAIMYNVRSLESAGINVSIKMEIGNCYIAAARNNCVKEFLAGDYDYLVFIDSDLWFDNDAIAALILADKDIVFGAYPYKWEDKRIYPIRLLRDENGNTIEENGLIKCEFGPTGLMCIKRSVFNKMSTDYPQIMLTDGSCIFFDTGLLFSDGVWYGEDVAFCKRWLMSGGEIWCEPNINFQHIGRSGKSGKYIDFYTENYKNTVK